MRKKSTKNDRCPWYQPSTQNQRLRTLLGSLSKKYDWKVDIGDFSFLGGLKGFLDKLYTKRFSEYRKVVTILIPDLIFDTMYLIKIS